MLSMWAFSVMMLSDTHCWNMLSLVWMDSSIDQSSVCRVKARVAASSLELWRRAFSDLISLQSGESKPLRAFFNGGCDCLLDAAVKGLFNGVCYRVLDVRGKGRCIHLIVECSQNLAETTENIIRAYCGGRCNSGVDQTGLCGTEWVNSRAAIKGHGVAVSAGGSHIIVKRHIDHLFSGKSHIVPEAGGMSHVVIVDCFILSAGKSHIIIVERCIVVEGEEWLGFVLRACTCLPKARV
jgi:hypothetical protein